MRWLKTDFLNEIQAIKTKSMKGCYENSQCWIILTFLCLKFWQVLRVFF